MRKQQLYISGTRRFPFVANPSQGNESESGNAQMTAPESGRAMIKWAFVFNDSRQGSLTGLAWIAAMIADC